MQDLGKIEAAADSGNYRSRSLRGGMQSAKDRPVPTLRRTIMAGLIEKKLSGLGVTLPTPASPIANYVPFVRSGNILVVSDKFASALTASWS